MLALGDDALREVGLSKAKTVALRGLAKHALDGRLPDALQIHDMDDDTIIERCSAAVQALILIETGYSLENDHSDYTRCFCSGINYSGRLGSATHKRQSSVVISHVCLN